MKNITEQTGAECAELLGWTMQVRGWWTHPEHGGICQEGGGLWNWYKKTGCDVTGFDTLKQAVTYANENH